MGKNLFEISFPILNHNNYLFLDIRKLLLDPTPLEKYPYFEKDFLVIKNKENISFR